MCDRQPSAIEYIGEVSESMRRKVEAFCLRQGLLPCRRLLIALSGGADSVTLLHVMKLLQPKYGYSLSAMHINHMIRGEEAERDEAFCRSLCQSLDTAFHSLSIDIPALSEKEHRGIEETARHYRYAALEAYAEEISADRIATAHTATDQIETVLMQLIRGSAAAGGIRPMRGKLVRPLLEVKREEILAYTSENQLSYVEDSSNADDRYTRNFIRHTILPAIKSINPSAEDAFGRFAALRRLENDYLDEESMRRLIGKFDLPSKHSTDPEEAAHLPIYVDLASLQAIESPLRAHAISRLCEMSGISGLSHAHFEAIDQLIDKGKNGASLSLPGAFCAIEAEHLYFSVASNLTDFESSSIRIEPFELKMGENSLPDGSILFAYRQINSNIEKYIKEKQNIYKLFINIELDFGKIGNVIRVRSRLPGDKIFCGGMHRKIKKCFCDQKIPTAQRSLQPILCDESGILWIPALRMARDGVTADHSSTDDRLLRLIYMGEKQG